jgi:uncharacterized protein YbjT (DUF2867 family)
MAQSISASAPGTGTIVVVGAAGLIGAKVVQILTANGVPVVSASRRTGVDVLTGEGLAAAMSGADVVVDVTDSPSYSPADLNAFFSTSTANLAAAEKKAGVRHHIALSVVGADRMPDSPYESAKVTQERAIADAGVPYTVLRATQFFEFAETIANTLDVGDAIRVPAALIQPIAADDVAAQLARIAGSAPANGIIEIGGPECMPISEFIDLVLKHQSDRRTVITDPDARYFGAHLEERTLITDSRLQGAMPLKHWLSDRNEKQVHTASFEGECR